MWLDQRPVYIPAMRHRYRMFPLRSLAVLALVGLGLIIFGDRLIHGYFWLIVHLGETVVRFLQWAGVCSL